MSETIRLILEAIRNNTEAIKQLIERVEALEKRNRNV